MGLETTFVLESYPFLVGAGLIPIAFRGIRFSRVIMLSGIAATIGILRLVAFFYEIPVLRGSFGILVWVAVIGLAASIVYERKTGRKWWVKHNN